MCLRLKLCQKELDIKIERNFPRSQAKEVRENLLLSKRKSDNIVALPSVAITQLIAYKNIICTNQY